jgi:tetratricopeptide (TPR) repeat protein
MAIASLRRQYRTTRHDGVPGEPLRYHARMPPSRAVLVDRFMRLPRRSSEVWQGGVVRARTLLEEPDGSVRRPLAAVWVSLGNGMMNVELIEGASADLDVVVRALAELGLKFTAGRPARLEVADAALGSQLTGALADPELAITVRADLPAVDHVLRLMEEGTSSRPPLPEALEAPGVTVERMRDFAEAAREFHQAALWDHLSDEDLVHVEAPKVAAGLRLFTVLGAAGQTFGLGFYARQRDFEAIHASGDPDTLLGRDGHWTLLFGPIDDMPFGDADLWEAERLAVAGPAAYPVAMWYGGGGKMRRPRANELNDLTIILRALGRTTEAEIDRGRFSHEVHGHAGPVTVTLAIPELLAPLEAPAARRPGPPDRRALERVTAEAERFIQGTFFKSLEEANTALREHFSGPIDDLPSTAATPLDKAQDVMYRAWEARGRRRVQLARRALELSADCADAYVLLAEESRAPEAALALYAQGVAAGERALGPDFFAQEAGRFWDIAATRPYMRARFGLAQALEDANRHDDAIEHYRELLRLNEGDNLGVRHVLLTALMLAGRDAETPALLARFDDEPTALWHYGRALAVFRREGDSPAARESLRAALRSNRHVPQYLADEADWAGPAPSSYEIGSREEAVLYDLEQGEAWRATPEALGWLRAHAPSRRSGKRRKR